MVQNFDRNWRLATSIEPVGRAVVDQMIKTHYLKKWPGVTVLILGMKSFGQYVGVIVYALPPRETCKRYGGFTWELARLWISDDIPRNAETWLISKSVKYIKRFFPNVKNLVSYADPSVGHAGIIYKAANWNCDGRTDQERKSPRCDYVDSLTGKKFSRKSHVPIGSVIERQPRISKHRFVLAL